MRRRGGCVAALATVVALAACGGSHRVAEPPATLPATQPAPVTAAPTRSAAASSCPATDLAPDPHRPVISLTFTIGADHRTVTGHEHVVFTPDQPVTELVYRLWPNGRDHRLGGSLTVTRATVGGQPVTSRFGSGGARAGTQGTLLSLPLTHTVPSGQSIASDLDFTLRLPRAFIDRLGSNGTTAWWGTGAPLLAWVRGMGWVRTPGSSTLAEMAVSEAARTDVTVTAPTGDTVLANGTPSAPVMISARQRRWHFVSEAARDVVVAVGPFAVVSAKVPTSAGTIPVTVGAAPGLDISNQELLAEVRQVLPLQVRQFGPYPFSGVEVAALPGLIGTGIEYPGMFLIGDSGDQSTVTHELTHMWFYGLVGDDQELHPWLDEAFATAGEEIVDAESYGSPVVSIPPPASATQPVDSSVSAFEKNQGGYDDVVYAKGADALLRARTAIGAAHFDAALRCYARANAWTVAYPQNFAAALARYPAALAVLRKAGALR